MNSYTHQQSVAFVVQTVVTHHQRKQWHAENNQWHRISEYCLVYDQRNNHDKTILRRARYPVVELNTQDEI